MHIKKSTVLPAGFKVTKCAPAEANAPSVYSLLKREERQLMSENQEERMREEAAAFYIANGYYATGIDENGHFY